MNSSVSVVVPTRNRADQLSATLKGVLSSTYADFEFVVVDQSDSAETADLARLPANSDPRLRWVRDSLPGAARARNRGIAETTGDIVVFTDDDCVPDPMWLETMVRALEDDPEAGVVFGSVIPSEYNVQDGFIVGFAPVRRRRLTGRMGKLLDGGIGANMAFRRAALAKAGGFDAMLGPGSYFPNCEDGELAYRVLKSGYALLHVPEARVTHYGLRDWKSGPEMIRRTYVAVAAAYMKHARVGDLVGLCLVAQQLGLALMAIVQAVARRRRPIGFRRLTGLLTGIVRSFELSIDSHTTLYRSRVASG